MKAKVVSMLCVRSALLGAGVLGVTSGAVSCSDIPIDCTVGRGVFSVQYIGEDKCGLGNGDMVGAQAYMGRGKDVGGAPEPDLTKAFGALQTARLGNVRDGAAGYPAANSQGTPYAYAPFVTPRPDGGNFCTISSMTAHFQNDLVPPVTDPMTMETDPGVAASNLTYAWSNTRFYVTPGIQGLQFESDLTYTDALYGTPPASCATSVKAVGVFPSPDCMTTTTASGVDAATDPPASASDHLTGSAPDNTVCTDLKKGGISTDFPTVCVPATAPEYQGTTYTCTPQADNPMTPEPEPDLCMPSGTASTHGFCFLVGAGSQPLPIVKK